MVHFQGEHMQYRILIHQCSRLSSISQCKTSVLETLTYFTAICSRFAYSHFAYSLFAYSHFAYSRFAYSGHSMNSRFAYSALFVSKHFLTYLFIFLNLLSFTCIFMLSFYIVFYMFCSEYTCKCVYIVHLF